jgi:dienelactone hydrolase
VGTRAAAVTLAFVGLLAPVACGGDDAPEVDDARPAGGTVVDDDALRVRQEERTVAGLRSLVVRPLGSGTWPLAVFVHGAGAPPEYYVDLLEDLASEGYVVVAPAMPGSVDHSDFEAVLALPFQPGRVEQVITAVTAGPGAIAAADPDRVVVLGHSLGGMTALAIAFNSCCMDQRVDAVVSIAGQLAPFPGGTYGTGTAPVLLVHGEADEVVPLAGSGEALQQIGASAHLLTVLRGDHGHYLGAESPAYPAVRDAVVAFLRATVGDDPQGGIADLVQAGESDGVRLTSRG